MTWDVTHARDLADEWKAKIEAVGARLTKGVSYAEATAVALADELAERPFAAVAYQPGNGTNYMLTVALLPPSVGAMLGGRLAVALPDWSEGGRACCFGLGFELDPWSVEDHLRLRQADAVPVAMLLTLLSAAINERGLGG